MELQPEPPDTPERGEPLPEVPDVIARRIPPPPALMPIVFPPIGAAREEAAATVGVDMGTYNLLMDLQHRAITPDDYDMRSSGSKVPSFRFEGQQLVCLPGPSEGVGLACALERAAVPPPPPSGGVRMPPQGALNPVSFPRPPSNVQAPPARLVGAAEDALAAGAREGLPGLAAAGRLRLRRGGRGLGARDRR